MRRPLEPLGSLKLKLSVVILAAVFTTAFVGVVGIRYFSISPWACGLIASALALAVVQVLARGLTAPLRAMAAAAAAMARGEHGQRVEVRGRDEVARLAATFNAMAAELEETDRVRRDLVANAAHELRTPVTALRAKLENVVDGVEPADPAALLAQVERLGLLVAQLLDLSRLESGGLDVRRAPVDVAGLITGTIAEAQLTAPAGRFSVDVTPSALTVDADAVHLTQILTNLLQNAVRHGPPGGRIAVSATGDAGRLRLEVADEGPGIPEGERERVFERFHRIDPARARTDHDAPGVAPASGGGAGLGLAIVRGLVELHGGTVRADAAVPRGCRMVVELPGASA